jgi:hypothetical protein
MIGCRRGRTKFLNVRNTNKYESAFVKKIGIQTTSYADLKGISMQKKSYY